MRAAAIVLWLACTEAWARQRQGNRKLVLRRSGGEESLAAGVARAASLVDAKQLDEAEALLLELRARDARRADLPPELRRGFAHLFEARADEDKDDAGPCDALAALAADAEDWEAVYDACRQAMARGGAAGDCAALVTYCERFALRSLDAEGAAAVLAGLPCGGASLRSALRPEWPLLDLWPRQQ